MLPKVTRARDFGYRVDGQAEWTVGDGVDMSRSGRWGAGVMSHLTELKLFWVGFYKQVVPTELQVQRFREIEGSGESAAQVSFLDCG